MLRALPAIAIGHEASILVIAVLVLGLGLITDPSALHLGAGVALIAFGLFRFIKPRAHFRWVMRGNVGRRELAGWSFLMSTAHGAGLMVAPVLIGAGAVDSAAASDHAIAAAQDQGLSIPGSGAGDHAARGGDAGGDVGRGDCWSTSTSASRCSSRRG